MKLIRKIMSFKEIFKNDNTSNEKTIIFCCYGIGNVS